MEISPTRIADVIRITPRRFGDHRGFFSETWNAQALSDAGIAVNFVQDNHSFTSIKGTLRGLHFQAPPSAQDKLVRVTSGAVVDVAVDVRVGSPSYGEWVAETLTAEGGEQLLIPKGFLHGFATLTKDVHFLYKCSDYYDPKTEGGVYFGDPDLKIDWGVDVRLDQLSGKDTAEKTESFANFQSPFVYKA